MSARALSLLRHAAPTLVFACGSEAFRLRMLMHDCVVGRGATCDVVLPDPGALLSRRHLRLTRTGSRVQAEDLSSNGVLHNGAAMPQEARLAPGDVLDLGPWTLRWVPPPTAMRDAPGEPPTAVPSAEDDEDCGLVGRSQGMQGVLRRVTEVASWQVPVLVQGETGTGKERVAQALHLRSGLHLGPFVALNCGALHAGTAASALFGHVRGAFTGADRDKAGAFAQAHGGTLFLDEIGELPLEQQAALLRVLETREVQPLGSESVLRPKFRLVAATHRDLLADVRDGRFREDLYYRIAVTTIRVPPLRLRAADIPALAQIFVQENALGAAPALSPSALRLLRAQPWPGNVRQLRNTIVRGLIACKGPAIRSEHLELEGRDMTAPWRTGPRPPINTNSTLPVARLDRGSMRQELLDALAGARGNRAEAARRLGISRSTFYERLRRAGLRPPSSREEE